jgi:transcriptional regulator with GAF, ATPase, and Fis domain
LLRFVAGEAEEITAVARPTTGSLAAEITQIERRMLRDALAAAAGNQSEAARPEFRAKKSLVSRWP